MERNIYDERNPNDYMQIIEVEKAPIENEQMNQAVGQQQLEEQQQQVELVHHEEFFQDLKFNTNSEEPQQEVQIVQAVVDHQGQIIH